MSSTPQQTLHVSSPNYKLFDSNAVAIATFFGTPVAGGALMALNYRRLGQGQKAAITLMITMALTALVILVAWNLPQGASLPIGLALLFGMRWSARSLQGDAIKNHIERGGQLASKGIAFGVGAAAFAVIFLAVFIPVYMANDRSVTIGAKDEVYYSGSATKDNAQALGNALKNTGYLTDRGVTVSLAKGTDGTLVSFVVKQGAWNQPGIISQFEEIGREVAPSIGGFPIRVRLMTANREIKKESTVGKAAFAGNDKIYYVGAASESDAKALGQALQSAGFFEGRGADVFLSKHNDGVALSFVVGQRAWDNPALVSDFERIVRQAAPSVGGLPVKLRLVDTSLDLKKSEDIS